MKIIFLHLCWLPYILAGKELEVITDLGKIEGTQVIFNGIPVRAFLGVPFAKPPVGENRFKKPLPVEPWTGTIRADQLPPGCVQYYSSPNIRYDDLPGKSLDCLYLNIWVSPSASSSNRKAVLFNVYPGGFSIGSNRLDIYDGRVLAALGDVIVVSINHRLSVEGFLYFGTEDAPGNMGLFDILEALKWVQSNIESFGGDKSRVTYVGQSSGAIAASMLLTSPLAEGLFARAILESGSAASLRVQDNDRDFKLSQALAEKIGCETEDTAKKTDPATLVNCLRDRDGLKLIQALGEVNDNPGLGLNPRYGDELLPRDVRRAIADGDFRGIDILIGTVQDEGSQIIASSNTGAFGFYGDKADKVNKTFAEELIRKTFKDFSGREDVVEYYLGNIKEDEEETLLYQVHTAAGDYARVCPSVYLAESVAAKNSSVYYYFFTHRPSTTPYAPWMGVVHVDENFFAFGYPLRYPQNYTASERRLSKQMLGVWTNFVKTGSPSLKPWPLYSKNSHIYRVFDTKGETLGKGLHLENCNFFRPYFGF